MKKTLLTLFVLVLVQSATVAQSYWSFNFNSLSPLGDLRNDSPSLWGGGANVQMMFLIKDSPLYLGASGSMNIYGSEKQDLMMPVELTGETDVTRRNWVANAMAVVRYMPQGSGKLHPFVDFSAGYSFAYTYAEFHTEINGECEVELESVLSDGTFTYGLGAGLEYHFSSDIGLHLSINSLRGGTVQYLTPSGMEYNQMIDTYDMDVRTSRLEYMMVNVGVSFPFIIRSE